MAQTVSIVLDSEDRKQLETIAVDRSRPLKHIQRAKIVLFSADRLPVLEVTRRAGVSRPAVWRWQQRFGEEGVEGFFSTITRLKIRRGAFKSVPDLEAEIARYIKEHNKSPKPFVWTKPAKAIFDKLAAIP